MNFWETLTAEERRAIALKSVATRKANKERINAIREEAAKKVYGLEKQIEELEIRLSNLQTMEALNTASCTLTGKALLPEEDIVRASLPWQQASGVYFLIANNEVVYVGQSVNVYSRISEHVSGKCFDRYAYVPCAVELLDKLESLYIHCLRPRLNGNLNGQIKRAPIPLDVLLKGNL